jgi:hypothetical protein
VSAYTIIDLRSPGGGPIRREVAAGDVVMRLMTMVPQLALASLESDSEGRSVLAEWLSRLGRVSIRVVLCGGAEVLNKALFREPDAVRYMRGLAPSPLRAVLAEPIDLGGSGAEDFLAHVLAAADVDVLGAILEAADLLEALLVAQVGVDDARSALRDHVIRWPTLRFFDDDDQRMDYNPFET